MKKLFKRPRRVIEGRKKITSSMKNYRKPGQSEKLKAKSRKQYRKTRGSDFELEGSTVLRSLDFLSEESMILPVYNEMTQRVEHMPVLRLTHVAQLLNITYQTLWRWSSETKQVPQPVLIDQTQGRDYVVYHVEEVRVMLHIIGDHLTEFKYYRKDHAATRKKVFENIEALRERNFDQPKAKSGVSKNGIAQKGQSARKVVRTRRSRSIG